MLIIGLLSSQEEADEIRYIARICNLEDRIRFLVKIQKMKDNIK